MPGVQKPHCVANASAKARCSGCGTPFLARPLVVFISTPLQVSASVRQERRSSPSMITEQAPHEPVNPYGASKLFFETRLRLTAALTETPDGTCIRDYIHVNDLADAHVRALQYLERGDQKDGGSLAVNLGTGQGHSVLEVMQAVEKVTGRSVRRKVGPRRPGDPPVLVADPTKAQAVLGWAAKRNLADIVASAWTWMQKTSSGS